MAGTCKLQSQISRKKGARAAKLSIDVRGQQSMSDLAIAYVFLSLLTLVIALLVAAILVTP